MDGNSFMTGFAEPRDMDVSMKPTTLYTKCGSIHIAYQVFGSGAIDLVYIPGWVSNIDLMWDCPELARFLEELGRIARVIAFDKRGTGLSDRVQEHWTLDERIEDIRAVMNAADSEKAILFGHWDGGSIAMLFAARYPDRVISLITFGAFARRKYSVDYPWAPTDQEQQVIYDVIETSWGNADSYLKALVPSRAEDKIFMNWLANYFRSGASPLAALHLTKLDSLIDVVDVLDSITVPTLILQLKKDLYVEVEEAQFIANKIKGAKLVELPGSDQLFWVDDTNLILGEIKTFVLNGTSEPTPSPTKEQSLSLQTNQKDQPAIIQLMELFHHDSFLKAVLRCIYVHLNDEFFGVKKLCKELGVSERQLQRKIKNAINKSPSQLINSVRLYHARKLLLERKCNISKVAFEIGFSCPSYFTQCFKKEFGINPSDLIKASERA